MARITVEDCVKIIPNRFELCLIASNRAKAILSGSLTNQDRKEKTPVIALREIAGNIIDPNDQRQAIINAIKNRHLNDNVLNSNSNIVEAITEEQEANIDLNDDTFVSENVEVED